MMKTLISKTECSAEEQQNSHAYVYSAVSTSGDRNGNLVWRKHVNRILYHKGNYCSPVEYASMSRLKSVWILFKNKKNGCKI